MLVDAEHLPAIQQVCCRMSLSPFRVGTGALAPHDAPLRLKEQGRGKVQDLGDQKYKY